MSSVKNIQLMVSIETALFLICTTLGSEESCLKDTAEVKNQNIISNTSCSIFLKSETNLIFHLLVDIGQGMVQSIEKGFLALGLNQPHLIIYKYDTR